MTWLVSELLLGPAAATAGEISYAALDTVLSRHLRDGRVDYGSLARDRGPLDRFLAESRRARPEGWTREEQVAFWVNVYNARVLDGVIRRPNLKSVLDVGKTLGVPTLGFFREPAVSAGRRLSLNDVEHEILRRRFRDPRVHFVLNCASASCPDLPARALRGSELDSALEAATRKFLANPAKNRLQPGGPLRLSSIFKWYRADFEAAAGTLAAFVSGYQPAGAPPPSDVPVRFLDYDWSLNGHW